MFVSEFISNINMYCNCHFFLKIQFLVSTNELTNAGNLNYV